MNDPQATLGFIMRPPVGFEALYQGTSRANPIAMVPLVNSTHGPVDANVRLAGIDPSLLSYAPATLGATVMILIPRSTSFGESLEETAYVYELRWRLRQMTDWQSRAASGTPDEPYHLTTGPGPGGFSVLPAYTTEVITPTIVGNGINPFIAGGGVRGVSGQGQLDPALNPQALAPNFFFPPILRPCVGDELSVVAYRTADPANWDFAGVDKPFSNTYGTDQGGAGHPILPNLGVWLFILNRNTTP